MRNGGFPITVSQWGTLRPAWEEEREGRVLPFEGGRYLASSSGMTLSFWATISTKERSVPSAAL